jgi:hypothetical protein
MAAGFNINRANCSIVYNVLRRVLFKRYKTNPTICLYIVILLPFKRKSSSLINLNTIPAKIRRLVEFVFAIFIYFKSFYINIDYIIIRVRFLLFFIILNLIKQLIGLKSLPFYSLRILFFILLILLYFLIISILLTNKRTNTRFLINRLGFKSTAYKPNILNTSLTI